MLELYVNPLSYLEVSIEVIVTTLISQVPVMRYISRINLGEAMRVLNEFSLIKFLGT